MSSPFREQRWFGKKTKLQSAYRASAKYFLENRYQNAIAFLENCYSVAVFLLSTATEQQANSNLDIIL
jgi:hypothetical protein